MSGLDAGALDRYITGNYGADQFTCGTCGHDCDEHDCEEGGDCFEGTCYSAEDAAEDAAIAAWEARREDPDWW